MPKQTIISKIASNAKKFAEAKKVKAEAKTALINAKTARMKQKMKGSIARSIARNAAAAVSSVAASNTSSNVAKYQAQKEVGIANANAQTALKSWNSIINSDATPVEGTGEPSKGGSTSSNTGSNYNDPTYGY